MSNQEWSTAIGLRRAAISLCWRSVVAALVWSAMLRGFHALLTSLNVTRVPFLIAAGFAILAGALAGIILSRGIEERAGFVSPLLTLMALAFTAAAIIGPVALVPNLTPTSAASMQFILVSTTMLIAGVWVVRATLLDR